MFKKVIFTGLLLTIASLILITSVFRSASPEYVFLPTPPLVLTESESVSNSNIAYYLPYPGILPTNFFWPLKAARDKVWLLITIDKVKKANLLLLYADKRIGMAHELFSNSKPEEGVPSAQKAEQYLKEAFDQQAIVRSAGVDTTDLLTRIAWSSLKHKEVIINISKIAPEDARPYLTEFLNITNDVYESAKAVLSDNSRPVPTY